MFQLAVFELLFQTLVPLPCRVSVHPLSVSVAERSTHGAHALPKSHVHWRSVTQVHVIVKRSVQIKVSDPEITSQPFSRGRNLRIPRRRRVQKGDCAINLIRTLVRLLVLPHPPDTIDLGVMQVEVRVAVGSREITAWVAADSEVASGVHAHEAISERRYAALHLRPEAVDRLAFKQAHDLLVVAPLAGGPGRDVALQAARVVSQTEERGLRWVGGVADGVWRFAGQAGEHRSEVYAEVFEGPVFDAAAAFTVGDLDLRCYVVGDAVGLLLGAAQLSVATHACVTAVECWGRSRVIGPFWPVVVRLVAVIAAFVSQRLFVGPDQEPVPSEKVARGVDGEGLVDVCCYEVVVSTSHTGCF
jgi:hypothetical protein